MPSSFCIYCGLCRAKTRDHVVPLAECRRRDRPSPGLTLPACEACNFYKADTMLHLWTSGPCDLAKLRVRVGEKAWTTSVGFGLS